MEWPPPALHIIHTYMHMDGIYIHIYELAYPYSEFLTSTSFLAHHDGAPLHCTAVCGVRVYSVRILCPSIPYASVAEY